MRVRREEFLQRLQAVHPGTTKRGIIEQSDCFAFQDGKVITFNGEVSCSTKSTLPSKITGAVQADPLIEILGKFPEDEILVEQTEAEFIIIGKNRRSGISQAKEVLLPLDAIEPAEIWNKLPKDFTEAIKIVHECAGSGPQKKFWQTCVHVGKQWIEACDNLQMARFMMNTKFDTPFLVKKEAIKHIVALDMTEFSETEKWVHFRNPVGINFTCCRYVLDGYKDLGAYLDQKGDSLTLPKDLSEVVEKAEVFSREQEGNLVQVEIRNGKMRITGKGVSGWYEERKLIHYKGPSLSFMIAPKLLVEITNKNPDCIVNDHCLKVNGGKWSYVTRIGVQQ